MQTSAPSVGQIFAGFLRLGLTSFGGPVAHLGYFREDLVARRGWLDDADFADLVALCQFLPGPASSQVGIGIGLAKGGLAGGLAAWVAFTAPSALALTVFGYGVVAYAERLSPSLLQGLKIAAVAVVAQALWGMARTLCPDPPRATFAALSAIGVLIAPTPSAQLGVIVLGGLAGLALLRAPPAARRDPLAAPVGRGTAIGCLVAFLALLAGLPWLAASAGSATLSVVDGFYRAGALVFGGGHVVLPLLKAEVVAVGWVSSDAFLAGYGAAQAVPGPLFTFAAYLGTVMHAPPNGWSGALVCLLAIFAPSFLLVVGALPFWERLRRVERVRDALAGVNAAVVGLLLAALYDPVWTTGVRSAEDLALTIGAFVLLVFWRTAPWLVVLLCALAGWGLGALGAPLGA